MEEPEKNVLQLGKAGMDDPSAGAPPPRTPRLLFQCILFNIGSVCSVFLEPSPEALVAAM